MMEVQQSLVAFQLRRTQTLSQNEEFREKLKQERRAYQERFQVMESQLTNGGDDDNNN